MSINDDDDGGGWILGDDCTQPLPKDLQLTMRPPRIEWYLACCVIPYLFYWNAAAYGSGLYTLGAVVISLMLAFGTSLLLALVGIILCIKAVGYRRHGRAALVSTCIAAAPAIYLACCFLKDVRA